MLRIIVSSFWIISVLNSWADFTFYERQEFSRAHWLFFIPNKRTDTRIYDFCYASTNESGQCYRKKHIDVRFKFVCPVINNEFRHNIVKEVSGFIRPSRRGSTAALTMLWWDSWSITGQTHEKLTSICEVPLKRNFRIWDFCLIIIRFESYCQAL